MTSFIAHYLPGANLDGIGEGDLRQFLAQKLEESQTLEYLAVHMVLNEDGSEKKPEDVASGRSKNKRRNLPQEYRVGWKAVARVVAAFANAEGGLLVLGVDEKDEKDAQGRTVRVHPGDITPFPSSITRESIQQRLYSLIRFEVEGLRICPVRLANNEAVYLIDVPQSYRAPHRVDDRWYFFRYNFECLPMTHYQIADAFGRRLAPDLDLEPPGLELHGSNRGWRGVCLRLVNRGRHIASRVLCLCDYDHSKWVLTDSAGWQGQEDDMDHDQGDLRYALPAGEVVYPGLPVTLPRIGFQSISDDEGELVELCFRLFAEGMPMREVSYKVGPPAPGGRIVSTRC